MVIMLEKKINKEKCRVLVDIGAEKNFVTNELIVRLKLTRQELLKPRTVEIANEQEIKIAQKVIVPFILPGMQDTTFKVDA